MLTLAVAAVAALAIARGAERSVPPGPRGQPIRPRLPAPGAGLTNAGVVTLPGGIVITNLPASVLPKSPTNIVRLPTTAARKFQPLGYTPTSFTVLARFFLNVPPPGASPEATPGARWEELKRQIPQDVLDLEGRKVAIAGFLLPVALEHGRTREFLLLRTQSACCFGLVPRVNELIIVNVPAPGVVPKPDVPVVVAGTLALKWIGEAGQLTAIYAIAGDQVERVEEKRGR